MNYERSFNVYRPVSPESVPQIESLQNEYASISSFTPADSLQLSIFSVTTWKKLPPGRLVHIIKNAPEVSIKPFESEIIGARLTPVHRHMSRYAISLLLDDGDDEHFSAEHAAFKEAFKKVNEDVETVPFKSPFVTIGFVDAEHALESTLENAQPLVGTTLNIGMTESDMGIVRHQTVDKPVRERIEPVHSVPEPNPPVRTIRPGGIPQGLLASLQRREADN